jgi:hypothetical protein
MAWERRASERARVRAVLGLVFGLSHAGRGSVVALALVAASALGGGCRQTVVLDPSADTGGTGGGGSAGGGPTLDGGGGNTGGGNHFDGGRFEVPNGFCFNGQIDHLSITPRSPFVIVSVDRSSSMQSWFGTGTRLQVVQEQVLALVAKYRKVFFGYEEFPSPTGMCSNQGCCSGDVTLPKPNNLKTITSAIATCDSNGVGCNQTQRPVADALAKCYGTYLNLFSPDQIGHRYVLLFLSGDPTCTGTDPMFTPCDNAVARVTKLSQTNTNTAVFGVGDSAVGSMCLDKLAQYGGLDTGGSPLYHLALSPTELSAALDPVVETIAEEACKIDLRSPPADPSKVRLLFDGVVVPNDGVDGWTFDQDTTVTWTVTVHGSYCRTLVQSTNQVELVTGCMPPHN